MIEVLAAQPLPPWVLPCKQPAKRGCLTVWSGALGWLSAAFTAWT